MRVSGIHASAMIAIRHRRLTLAALARVAALLLAAAGALPAQQAPGGIDALLPRAAQAEAARGQRAFALPPALALVVPSNASPLRAMAVQFAARLRAQTGATVHVTTRAPQARDARYIMLDTGLAHRRAEAYELVVDSQRVDRKSVV